MSKKRSETLLLVLQLLFLTFLLWAFLSVDVIGKRLSGDLELMGQGVWITFILASLSFALHIFNEIKRLGENAEKDEVK